MWNGKRVLWTIGVSLAMTQTPLEAALVTGDPSGDGWTSVGNSLATGVYIRGEGAFDFGVYSTSFQLESTSPLLTGGWQAGDIIIGIGGIFSGTNDNLTTNGVSPPDSTSARIVAKFGTSTALFTPDANGPPPPPTGIGSFSSGAGGLGSIQLSNPEYFLSKGAALNNGGSIVQMPVVTRYDGSSVDITLAAGDIGRLAYTWTTTNPDPTTGRLNGFEVLLNASLLAGLGYVNGPAPGHAFDLAIQRGTGDFTDAFGLTPELSTVTPSATAVPEPTSLAVWGLGSLGIGLFLRRRRGMS